MKTFTNIRTWSVRAKNAAAALLFLAAYTISMVAPFVPTAYAAAAANIDQWANSAPTSWQNGNLNENNSAYREGESVPFRAILTDLSSGSHVLDIQYDNVDSGKHAYDYLTSFDRSYSPNPCAGVAIPCTAGTTGSIPTDPTLNPVAQVAGQIKIFGANITSVAYLGTPPGHNLSSAKKTSIRVTFSTTNSTAVIAWGGHIAKESDWGVGSGASAISGSPYHQRILALDGSGGSQDRSLKASAVILLPRITITKVVQNGTALPSNFSFNVSPAITEYPNPITIPSGQSSVTIFDIVPNGAYSITENTVNGYGFVSGTNVSNCLFDGSTATATVAQGTSGNVKNASCSFTNAQLPGSITIVKDANPNDPQDFAFTTTGTGLSSFNLDDDSNATLQNTKIFPGLTPGSYSVSEANTSGWDLTGLSCISDKTYSTLDTSHWPMANITLAAGENVTCTYTNTKQGKIIVEKQTSPNGSVQSFAFSSSYDNDGFSLSDGQTNDSGGLTPGTYSVSETVPGGWTQTSAVCDDGSPVTAIIVTAGETVKCTFTNTKLAKLTIIKDAIPNEAQDFTFTTSANLSSFSLEDDSDATLSNTKVFTNLAVGQAYSVTESTLTGWKLNGLVCSDGVTVDLAKATISFTSTAGQEVTCTYTNVKLASISGTKWNDIDGDGKWDAGEPTLDGWAIALTGTDMNGASVNLSYVTGNGSAGSSTAKGTGAFSFEYLLPGTYTVTERMTTEQDQWWDQTSANPAPINLTAGQIFTGVNFGNRGYGTITIIKQLVPSNDPGKFNLKLDDVTKKADVGDEGTTDKLTVPAGTYDIAEAAGTATTLSNYNSEWACAIGLRGTSNDGTSTSVTVEAGEEWVCTFTNERKQGTVKVVKDVVNDNGGTKTAASDFTFTNNDGTELSFEETTDPDGQRILTLPVGSTFDIEEVQAGQDGYTTTYSGTCAGTVTETEQTCMITNDDNKPTLELKKIVSNQYNGQATEGDWKLTATNSDANADPVSIGGAGGVTSGDLFDAGTYTLAEAPTNVESDKTDNYTASKWECNGRELEGNTITIALGQSMKCEITNLDTPAAIMGNKTIVNANSSLAVDQTAAKDWEIWLYSGTQNGETYWTYLDKTTTAADGTYSFTGLKAGLYKVWEVLTDGWTQIFGSENVFSVGMGETYGDGEGEAKSDFGNFENGSIDGVKFEDVDGDGEWDEDEPTLAGWTIVLENTEDESFTAKTTITTTEGYSFDNLAPGTYTVCEDMSEAQADTWLQTYPKTDEGCYEIVIDESGETNTDIDFGNFKLAEVNGYKWSDLDGDAEWDEDEPALADWEITLTNNKTGKEWTTTTDEDGKYSFTGLTVGQYIVCEDLKDGWVQTYPIDITEFECNNAGVQKSGAVYERNFGNMQLAQFTIVKDVQPDSTKAFSFKTNLEKDESGADKSFSLIDDGSGLGTNSKKFSNVLPGTYIVTEAQLDGWKLDNIACTGTGVMMTRDAAKLTVTLAAGAVASCTFVNSFIPQVLAETFTLADTGTGVIVTSLLAMFTIGTALLVTLYRRKTAVEWLH